MLNITKGRAIFLLIALFVLAMSFALRDCSKYSRKNLKYDSYIYEFTLKGKVEDIQNYKGEFRINLNNVSWYYPEYQIDYLKQNLEIGDSIVKLKGRKVKIYKKEELNEKKTTIDFK